MANALRGLLHGFPANPGVSRLSMRQLMNRDPGEFILAAFAVLSEGRDYDPMALAALGALLSGSELAGDIAADPTASDLLPAAEVCRAAAMADPSFEVSLIRRISAAPPGRRSAVAYRVLDLLGRVSQGSRVLPFLLQLSDDPDRWIRSKVALMVGRWCKDTRLLSKHLNDPDPRVRANAVESLWGAGKPVVLDRFVVAAADYHHRVSANGIVGLHLAGSDSVAGRLESMLAHPDENFQAAAAWAAGRCHQAGLKAALQRLASEPGAARCSALRALVELGRCVQ
ncbi:MAG: HEAT repeat domain-containing protein [Acidobacteria bacterium]|nr:HEAT repeat domain-containing protein [Acidobacteriota bacterium]